LIESPTFLSPSVPMPSRIVAGFWRRLFAFVIDALITAVPCGLLGFGFYNFFCRSQAPGMLIGFAVTLPYFAILGSSEGGGRTVGHRITRLEVVDRQGKLISAKRSFLRYLILLAAILLTSAALPVSGRFGIKASIDWLLVGAEFAIGYLYLFNRRTRQSLHDLATGTYVVDAGSVGEVQFHRLWAGHWAILGGALVGAALLSSLGKTIRQTGPFPELTAVQLAVLESGKVQSVSDLIQENWTNGETSTTLNVIVVWKDKPLNIEKNATEIADIVLRADPRAVDRVSITVTFHEGFKIGFATFSKNRHVSHNAATWREQIQSYGLR
jgi:uncharacterized RDD family membrane protein YckC